MRIDGRVPMEDVIVPKKEWQVVGLDILGPYQMKNGEMKQALIAVCCLTGETMLCGLPDMTAQSAVEKLVLDVWEHHGVSEYLVGDRCKQFLCSVASKIFEEENVTYHPSVAYHHQGNARVERQVQTAVPLIKEGLFDLNMSWRNSLRRARFILNKVMVSDATGMTPHEATRGSPYNTGFDNRLKRHLDGLRKSREDVREKVLESRMKSKQYYDEGKKIREFKEGDLVMVLNRKKKSKFDDDRVGPFKIEKKLGKSDYLIFDHRLWKWDQYNISQLYWPEGNAMKSIPLDYSKKEMIRDSEPEEKLEKSIVVNDRVRVWFEDKKKNFRGIVRSVLSDERYMMEWENKSEAPEIVELKASNRTDDPLNTDRWEFIKASISS
jgi:predicted RNA-binding protein